MPKSVKSITFNFLICSSFKDELISKESFIKYFSSTSLEIFFFSSAIFLGEKLEILAGKLTIFGLLTNPLILFEMSNLP